MKLLRTGHAPEPMNPPVVGRPGELLDRFLARLIDGLIIGVVYLGWHDHFAGETYVLKVG